MPGKIDWIKKRKTLRKTAADLLPGLGESSQNNNPTETLLNELMIHKIELELQIDELKRANLALEASRDRYFDLYDQSPVGFITINRDGLMTEMNLNACSLLGMDRHTLRKERFSNFVVVSEREDWHLFFLKQMKQLIPDFARISINLASSDGSIFRVHIEGQRIMNSNASPTLRLTLIDSRKLALTGLV
jgi:PAS domain S-box-containing protein